MENTIGLVMLVVELVFVLALPVAVAFWWRGRTGALWSSLGFGALTFVAAQLVRLPLLQVVALLVNPTARTWDPSVLLWVNLTLLVITSGLFEEGARWLVLRRLAKNVRSWQEGVMYGIGHGGIEAILITGGGVIGGLVMFATAPTLLAQLEQLPPDQAAAVQAQLDALANLRWWEPLLGGWERVAAMIFHTGASLLVLLGVLRRDLRLLGAAMLLHMAFNAAAVVMIQFTNVLATEAVITLVALFPLWLIFRLRQPIEQASLAPVDAPTA